MLMRGVGAAGQTGIERTVAVAAPAIQRSVSPRFCPFLFAEPADLNAEEFLAGICSGEDWEPVTRGRGLGTERR